MLNILLIVTIKLVNLGNFLLLFGHLLPLGQYPINSRLPIVSNKKAKLDLSS
jgi:hypothetical protein